MKRRSLAGAALALALALALAVAGCAKKKQEPAPAPASSALTLTEIELTRGKEACAAYQQQACEAAKRHPERPELAEACRLAPALEDAMKTALEIAQYPESTRRDVLQAQDSLRKTMKHCLEGVAKLAGQ